jgi:hypothetical protein
MVSGRARAFRSLALAIACVTAVLSSPSVGAGQPPPSTAPGADDAASSHELNKQLNNPVSSIWSLNFQNNFQFFEGRISNDTHWQYNLNFQPVIPLRLTEGWNLITRPIIPVLAGVDVPDPARGTFEEHSGLGDMSVSSFLSPAHSQGFLWGLGPSFIFPTASSDELGAGKYQAGPAVLGLYMGKEWIVGGLLNQWWSFAGDGNRASTSSMNLQYFVFYLLPDSWQVGMSPNVQVNWKADSDNKLTLPIGIGVGKLFKFGKLPVKFTLEVDYALIKPEDYGQRWTIRFQMIPVLPALVKDVLFK